nr:hypothetical protein [Candidatus Sigynarchaeota archaeon]
MVYTWERFGVFAKQPLLDFSEPLINDEDLEKYFVILNNHKLKTEILDRLDSQEGAASLFGQRFLILGDYKVGKTSLKNYIVYRLKKSFNILHVDINVAKIEGMTNSEEIHKVLFSSWYRGLCKVIDKEKLTFSTSEDYLEKIIEIYEDVFTNKKYPYERSVVVLDQANKLEKSSDVEPFKKFCDSFQGSWEQEFTSIKDKLLILCCGHRDWVEIFDLSDESSFGVFPKWIMYGYNWDRFTLKEALERRIKNALKPEFESLVSSIVTEVLVKKLSKDESTSITKWIDRFNKYLTEFGDNFSAYGEKIENFDKYLEDSYDLQEKIEKQVRSYQVKTIMEELNKFRNNYGSNVFSALVGLLEHVMYSCGGNAISKGNLKGILDKNFSALTQDFIIEKITEGNRKETPTDFILFKTTPDNTEIMIKENFYDFLKFIKNNFNQKPSDFLDRYLDNAYPRLKKQQINIESRNIEEIYEALGSLQVQFENHQASSIIKASKQEVNANLKPLFEKIMKEEDESKKNENLIELKASLCRVAMAVVDFVVSLYFPKEVYPYEDMLQVFSEFIKLIKSPTDDFDYEFLKKVNQDDPGNMKELLADVRTFIKNLQEDIEEFNTNTQRQEQKRIIKEVNHLLQNGKLEPKSEDWVIAELTNLVKIYCTRPITQRNCREFLDQINSIEEDEQNAKVYRDCMVFLLNKIVENKYYYTINDIGKKIIDQLDNFPFLNNLVYLTSTDDDDEVKSGSFSSYIVQKITVDPRYKFKSKSKVIEELKALKNKTIYVVFIDDFIGTGEQFIPRFKSFTKDADIHKRNNKIELRYLLIAAIGTEIAQENILTKTDLKPEQLKFATLIHRYQKAFHKQDWKDVNILEKFTSFLKKLDETEWNGRNGSELLIIFEYNTPNNTISCLWKQILLPNGKNWKPLFPRTGQLAKNNKETSCESAPIVPIVQSSPPSDMKPTNTIPFEQLGNVQISRIEWVHILLTIEECLEKGRGRPTKCKLYSFTTYFDRKRDLDLIHIDRRYDKAILLKLVEQGLLMRTEDDVFDKSKSYEQKKKDFLLSI